MNFVPKESTTEVTKNKQIGLEDNNLYCQFFAFFSEEVT